MASNALQKVTNRLKAKLEEDRSPVEKDRATVPIADAMRAYWERDMLSFAIPAHNGGRGPAPDFTRWAGPDAACFDLPMRHGVDTGNRAWKVQSTALAVGRPYRLPVGAVGNWPRVRLAATR